jgi:uncharacterized protein (DUF2147 family)
MMKKVMLLCLILLAGSMLHAQDRDAIVGKWQNPSGEGRIEIFKKGDSYFGKLYWLKEPNENGKPKLDKRNPDRSKKARPLKDLVILTDFQYAGDAVWEDGQIYDPKSGKTYSCKMTLKGDDKLDIRGYVGISLIGRSEIWTRIK